jgi:hypothetical protein
VHGDGGAANGDLRDLRDILEQAKLERDAFLKRL